MSAAYFGLDTLEFGGLSIMRRLNQKIKIIALKFFLSLIKMFYTSTDKKVVSMRNDFNAAMTPTGNGLKNNSIRNIRWQVTNINYKLDLIMDYYLKPAEANPATGTLDLLQKEMLEILLLFKTIADNHKISYWLDYGTLLGAVRHAGFVPWDSDVDVSIMEDDLPYLAEILNEELPDEYEFVAFWLDRVYRIRKKDSASQAFMDIYPYLIYGRDSENNYKIRMRHGGDNPKVKTYRPHRPFPSSILFPQSEVEFCGYVFKAPNDTDAYLRLKYGNYRVLPKSVHTEPGHPVLKEDIVFYPDDFVK